MILHKEGKVSIAIASVLLVGIVVLCKMYLGIYMRWLILVPSIIIFGLVVHFFKNPKRIVRRENPLQVNCPADGKVVVIEEVIEDEYFHDKRLQISIFMSPLNVHSNKSPIDGEVKYYKYHKGKYLVAWHPKSSTDNERNTVVFGNNNSEILVRQIAGAVARRIVSYVDKGDKLVMGDEFGFIKFGSRVDVFLPLGAEINVSIDQKVKANIDVLAFLKT